MNKVILIGNLARDPENNVVGDNISVCKFSIAVARKIETKDGTKVDFFNVIAWRTLADNCGKFLKKGNKAAVVGVIQNRTYEQDGVKKFATDIIAEEVEFLTPKLAQEEGDLKHTSIGGALQKKSSLADFKAIADEALPF